MEIVGGRVKREWVYMCLWLIEEVVQQNLTQHCKAVILQKYIYTSKEKKKTDNPVLKNPPDSTRNTGLIVGPGTFHMLRGD